MCMDGAESDSVMVPRNRIHPDREHIIRVLELAIESPAIDTDGCCVDCMIKRMREGFEYFRVPTAPHGHSLAHWKIHCDDHCLALTNDQWIKLSDMADKERIALQGKQYNLAVESPEVVRHVILLAESIEGGVSSKSQAEYVASVICEATAFEIVNLDGYSKVHVGDIENNGVFDGTVGVSREIANRLIPLARRHVKECEEVAAEIQKRRETEEARKSNSLKSVSLDTTQLRDEIRHFADVIDRRDNALNENHFPAANAYLKLMRTEAESIATKLSILIREIDAE